MSIITFLVLRARAFIFAVLLVAVIGALLETLWNWLRRDDYNNNETWTS